MHDFGVVGTGTKSGNIELLEAMSLPREGRENVLRAMQDACDIQELIGVFTCNRAEFYYLTDGHPAGNRYRNRILDFLLQGKPARRFEPNDLLSESSMGAVRHLFNVASSLDSMVIGDAQILGQLKEAESDCHASGTSGSRLGAIFSEAFRVARKVRRQTELGKSSVSMISLVKNRVREFLKTRNTTRVAIVGTGPMSEKFARILESERGIELTFVNRTKSKAETLAERMGGQALSLDEFMNGHSIVDILFSATAAPNAVFSADFIATLQSHRVGDPMPLLLLDLAVPRDIEHDAAAVAGITYCDIAFFQEISERGRRDRFRAADSAAMIVSEELARIQRQHAERVFRPVFAESLNEGRAYAHAGLKRLFESRLNHLDQRDHDVIKHFVDKLVAYVNQLPLGSLAEMSDPAAHRCSVDGGGECVQDLPPERRSSNAECSVTAGYECLRKRSDQVGSS